MATRLIEFGLRHLLLIIGVAAGLIIRIAAMRSGWGAVNSDEAVGLLMAQSASHGHFYTFFWGQNYGGTFILILEAPLVALFGLHLVVFRATDLVLLLIASLLLRSIALRFVSSREADMAALFLWLLPPSWVQWSGMEYVFWTTGIGFVLASVWCTLRWAETDEALWLAGVGVSGGLALWSYPILMSLLLPVLVAVVWRLRRRPGAVVGLLLAMAAGLLPVIYSTLARGVFVLGLPLASHKTIVHRFGSTIVRVLPAVFLTHTPLANNGAALDLVGLGLLIGVACFTLRRFLAFRRQRTTATCGSTTAPVGNHRSQPAVVPVDLFFALVGCTILLWPIILVASRVQGGVGDYRYGFIVIPPLCLIAAHLLNRFRLSLIGVGAAVAVTAVVASSWTGGFTAYHQSVSYKPIEKVLIREHRTHVFASYWIAYTLSFFSGETITASAVPVAPGDPLVRDLAFQELAMATPGSTYVVFANFGLDSTLRSYVRSHHVGTRQVVNGVAVYRFNFRIAPGEIPKLYGAF